ncbi:MAG: hypothetical protein EBZ83_01005 [Verrucomicrobia bacterium]|nr:hypothetical protein [Verrucomicrobiota bacterium]
MGLSLVDIETAELAGELLNLGTVALPHDVVSKGGARNEDEKRRMREAILRSADLIGNLEFQGPVADTIRQAQERVDGTGFPNLGQGCGCRETARRPDPGPRGSRAVAGPGFAHGDERSRGFAGPWRRGGDGRFPR